MRDEVPKFAIRELPDERLVAQRFESCARLGAEVLVAQPALDPDQRRHVGQLRDESSSLVTVSS
jgi:hypothetical protein